MPAAHEVYHDPGTTEVKGLLCLCSEKRFMKWVRAHLFSFCAVLVFSNVYTMSFSLSDLILTWCEKPLMLRESTCQLTKMSATAVFK